MKIASKIIACISMIVLLGGGITSCSEDEYPDKIVFATASHRSSPVFSLEILVNGKNFERLPSVASPAWENPKGGSVTLGFMPYNKDDKDIVIISAKWVELFTQRGWSGQIILPLSKINTLTDGYERKSIIVGLGRNGELIIHTRYKSDHPSGITAVEAGYVCGQRAPELDHDYEQDIGKALVYEKHFRGRGGEQIPTRCPDPER